MSKRGGLCSPDETLIGLLGDDPWFSLEVSIAHPVRLREVRLVCRDRVATLTDPYADHVLLSSSMLEGAVERLRQLAGLENRR
jgi:hypothetical protein